MKSGKEKDLKDEFPAAWEKLQQVSRALEAHYRDVCDIEFVIDQGQLFITGVRIARRTPRAALRIAIDLLREGIISATEVVERISLDEVLGNLRDEIEAQANLQLLCYGLPASSGAATGRLLILDDNPRDDALQQTLDHPTILVAEEFNPLHIEITLKAVGLISTRGGMTSHAAVIARGLGLPCITGAGDLQIDFERRLIRTPVISHEEGAWLTMEGSEGRIYVGQAQVNKRDVLSSPDLLALAKIIEFALIEGSLRDEEMPKAWLIRDMLCHSWVPPIRKNESLLPLDSFLHAEDFGESNFEVDHHPERLQASFSLLYEGFLATLNRLLARYVGLGRHWQFMRPLWDPMTAVRSNVQFVGLEFFNINHFVPHLIDISSISFVMQVSVRYSSDLWRLDHINPRGDSLVSGSWNITGSSLWVNEARVKFLDIPDVYHHLRCREYYWRWYEANRTSREEIIGFLRSETRHKANLKLYRLAFQLGLVKDNQLTHAGSTLVALNQEDKPKDNEPIGYNISSREEIVEKIVDHAIERGYERRNIVSDDYAILLQRREFQEVVIGELYESYFPPSRHEFDYLLIREIVDAVVHNPTVSFAAGALTAGVIGNAAYDLAKRLAEVIAKRFRGHDEERAEIWTTLAADIDKIESFFRKKEKASTQEFIEATGIDRDRLIPLLKLLGFRFERAKGKTGWARK